MSVSLQRGLVGHWTMDSTDAQNRVITDSSAYGTHGTIIGSPEFTDSTTNTGLQFSGDGERIELGTIPDAQFQSGDSFTVCFWVRGDGQPSDYPMAISPESVGSTNAIWSFLQNNSSGSWSGTVSFRVQDGGSRYDLTTSLSKGELAHYCCGVNTDTSTVFVYKNGVESQTTSGELNPNSAYPGDWTIGAGNSSPEYQWNGNINDVRIYNRALSQTEIQLLANQRSRRRWSVSHSTDDLRTGGQTTRVIEHSTYSGKDVTVERDRYGDWILVLNYEHAGGTNPNVGPGSTFPQLPNGLSNLAAINARGSNGELRHVDNITQYGIDTVDAVRLEAVTENHTRKIHYFTENKTVIDSIVPDSTKVSYTDITSQVTKYDDHTANLPDSAGSDTGENSEDHIFGPDFPMYNASTHHWAVAGFGNRWEVDDYPNDNGSGYQYNTVHRVWVRISGGIELS